MSLNENNVKNEGPPVHGRACQHCDIRYASAFRTFVKNFERPLHNPASLRIFELKLPHKIENILILLLAKFDYNNYKDLDMRV